MGAIKSIIAKILHGLIFLRPIQWNISSFFSTALFRKALPIPVYLFLFFFASGYALADCSISQGKIVINEYNLIPSSTETGVPYVELKINDPEVLALVQGGGNPFLQGAGTQEWTLASYNSTASQNASKNLGTLYTSTASNTANNYCSATTTLYIRVPFASNEINDDSNIVLRDNYGNIVDVLRVAMKKNATATTLYTGLPACSLCEKTSSASPTCTPSATQLQYDNDFVAGNSAAEKNIQRLPDGTGIWREAFGNGSNSEDSLCTTNDNILLVTKTASPQSFIAAGSTVTYTITVKNGSNTTDMTGVTMTDIIPTGLTYVSNSVGATYTGATRTLSWSVGALAKGISASMTVTATVADDTIAITNTATATSTQLAGVVTQGSATINAIKITITPLTATVALNGSATYTVTVENRGTSALYGVKLSIPQPTGVTFPTGAVSQTIGTLAAGASSIYTLVATGTQTGTKIINAYATTTNYLGSTFSASADLVVSAAMTPAKFNCIESGTAANTGRLYTKLAGTPFSFDVAALKTDGTVETSYVSGTNKDVTVELGYATDAACTGWTAVSPAVSQTLSFAAADAGRKAAASMTVSKAYPNLRCRVTDANQTPNVVACSVDNFAIRPPVFTITSTDATNNAATGTPVIKAGANFNLTATALAGYNGTPLIDNTKVVGTSIAGSLSGSFAAANSATGVASGSAFTYSEVGNFGLNANAVYDATFTSVDTASDCTADFSNVLVGGKYGCKIGSIAVTQTTGSSGFGRFIPDHFDTAIVLVSSVPMACPTGFTCPILYNGAVYSGQAFTVKVTAFNGLATPTITANYNTSTGLSKLVTLTAWNALGSTVTQNPGPGSFTVNTNLVAASTFAAGVATSAIPVYSFATTPTVPTNIYLRADETGGDAVTSLRATASNSVEGGVLVMSGRLKLSNVYGSELLPLTMLANTQLYTSNGWVNNSSDSNTVITLAASYPLVKNGVTTANTTAASPTTGTFSAGTLSINLAKPTGGGTGTATITPTVVPSYLPLTSGTATFGVYKGNNDYIYQRETY